MVRMLFCGVSESDSRVDKSGSVAAKDVKSRSPMTNEAARCILSMSTGQLSA